MEIIIVLIVIGFIYLLLKPTAKPKSKEYKQFQIKEEYRVRLTKALSPYKNDRKRLVQEKTTVLKSFASELNRSLFFDEDEVREFIQELASSEI